MNIDALIDALAMRAAIQSGVSVKVIAARNGGRMVPARGESRVQASLWTPDEKRFLREHIGLLTDQEIGDRLGRSPAAIKIKRQRWGYPAHSKRPGWLTGNDVAKILGTDIHAIMKLTDLGILPHVVIPGERGILNIREGVLKRWAVNPENWIYFKRHKVTDAHLRRLIELRAARWGDEWWTPGQVAKYLDVNRNTINHFLHTHRLHGKRWGNWWYKRSEVVNRKWAIFRGKGSAGYQWNPEVDAFLILAVAVGLSLNAVNRILGWNRTADYRLRKLWQGGEIPAIIERHKLPVLYRDGGTRPLLWADWRQHRGRFPRLAKAMDRFAAGKGGKAEMLLARGVIESWLDWFALKGARMVSMRWGEKIIRRKLWEKIEKLRLQGKEIL